jgi:hypothetical protein
MWDVGRERASREQKLENIETQFDTQRKNIAPLSAMKYGTVADYTLYSDKQPR